MRSLVRVPLRRLVRIPALIGVMLLAPSGDPVEAQTINPCVGKKLGCVTALAVAHDACYAKAAKAGKTLDPVCTQKARTKFSGPKGCIAKAEKKPGCLTTGDADALATVVESFVGDLVAALDPDFPTGVKNKCTGGKHGCVATKVKALLKCHVKAAKKGVLDPACTAAAIAKFDGGSKPAKACFTKLEAKGGCVTTGDRDALKLLADDFVRAVVCALDAVAPTCDLATPIPTFTPLGSAGTPGATPSPTPSASPGPETLPPDPVSIAPPVDPGIPASIADATAFLYTGADPVQTGVAPDTIESTRVAVLRGRVSTRDGQPLPDVVVTILNHPELGQTLTRANGVFDLAVNGGGNLVVSFERTGFLPAQRQVYAPWNDYAIVPTVVLIALDAKVTAVDLTAAAPMQIARGSTVSDADGSRQATVMFPQGTTATMVFPNGSTQPLTGLSVRATEYTVGANGPAAMPAELPSTSGYTYCAELSVDEAIAAGAATVEFSAPLPFYVENFLGFPVGMDVPLGSYDRIRGVWIPEANGKVIKMLGVTGPLADVDSDGDDIADAALAMSDAERQQLATLYAPGQTLQRMLVTHFTPYDANMPVVPPPDAIFPQDDPEPDDPLDDSCLQSGNSVIECQNQILGETIGLIGSGFGLQYQSDRAHGYLAANTIEIPLSGALPASILGIELDVEVAGRQFHRSFPPTPNQRTTFTWDGKDAYGRFLDGPQPATVRINYVYPAVYASTTRFGAPASGAVTVVPSRDKVKLSRIAPLDIGTYHAPSAGLGGWTLTPHHAYVPATKTLYRGDGRRESASAQDALGPIITTFAGGGAGCSTGDGGPATAAGICSRDVALGADGSAYIVDTFSNRVRRVRPDGIIVPFAGTGTQCASATAPCGDGGLATQAELNQPFSIAVDDDSVYIGEVGGMRVRKVAPDGIITTIAGTGVFGTGGDGGPATLAQLRSPQSLAVGPDGALYIGDVFANRVRHVGPDGIVTTVAGLLGGCNELIANDCQEGIPAAEARLNVSDVAVGSDGSLYIAGTHTVKRIGPDGIVRRIAGSAGGGPIDGVPPLQANLFPKGIAVGADDTIYIVSSVHNRITSMRLGGNVLDRFAGTGVGGSNGDGGPARRAAVADLTNGIAVGPDGNVYFAQENGAGLQRVRRVAPIAERFIDGELVIPAVDGSEVYVFTPAGRHLRTVDALTGVVRYQFTYDAAGRLASVKDRSDNVTTVERNAQGEPTGILGPFGQRTLLELDANGYLSKVTNPADEAKQLVHTPDGLLTSFVQPGGQTSSYAYDDLGRLIGATDPTDKTKTLTRTGTNKDHTVTLTSPLGRSTVFRTEHLGNGDIRLTTTDTAGAQSQLLIGQDGSRSSTAADGTTTTLTLAPDPRWGMRAPIPASLTTTTPGGRTRTITMQRTVALTGPSALLSLATLTDTVTLNGRAFTSNYVGATRTLTATWPTGRQQKVVFDDDGRVAEVQLGNLEPTVVGYDARGRLATATRGTGGNARTVTLAYDADGFLQSVTDPLARAFGLTTNDAGRVTQITQPSGAVIGVASDPNGNVVSVTPPDRPDHTFGYTARDQVSSYTAPAVGAESRVSSVTYDADRLATRFDHASGPASTFEYDDPGRVRLADVAGEQRTYGYDAVGRLASVATAHDVALAYGYDGSLTTSTTWSGAVAGSVARTHDDDFRVSALSVNGGDPIAIQYDSDGFPMQVGALVLTRDAQTALLTGTTLGGLSDTIGYDGFGRPAAYAASHDGSDVYAVAYERDLLGRITSKSETISGVTHVLTYAYELDGGLKEVREDGALIATYAYDGNGNRLSFTGPGGTTAASYDARDRLVEYGTTTYAHNPRGERVSKTAGAQTTTYDYDGNGALTGVTLPNGTRVDYLLDGLGRRLGRKVDGTLVQGFLYQDDRPIAELDGGGAVVSRFVYANASNVPAYLIKGDATYRIVTDQLGSPRVVIDVATGEIAQRLEHDEFGRVLLDTSPGFQPFGFAGGLYDPLTELVHFGAREYDPESGRWTTRDPSGFSDGSNLYAYVTNDPVNLVDPSGTGRFPQHFPYQPALPVNPVGPAPAPPPVAPPPPAPPPPPPQPFGPADPKIFRVASQPVYQVPVAAEGSGTAVAQCSRVAQVLRAGGSVAIAFAVGYGIGTAINETFDISGKASDRGVRIKEAFLESGYTEGTADFFGLAATLGFLSPDGARAVDTVLLYTGY